MKFALLTNQVRAARRPPYYVSPVDAGVFARLFPGMVRPASPIASPKNARPGQSLPTVQKHGKKTSPVQIPMEVFSAPEPSRPAGHASTNGNHRQTPLNGKAIPPTLPANRVVPTLPARNGTVRSGEPRKIDLETAVGPPSIPIPKSETTEPPRQPQVQEKKAHPPEKTQAPESSPRSEPSRPDFLHATRSALGLQRLLEQHPDIPDQSIVLGVCEDGLPVVLDLFDPGPGALLAVGDERDSQIELLRNAIDSAASRNTPRSLQFLVISHQPQNWQAWVNERGFSRHCLDVVGVEEESVRDWTLRLADWSEQRRLGQISGPPVLLVMDTLSFLPRLAYDVRLNFDWMAKEGPPAQVWPLAAISTDLAASLGIRMLRGFQTRILGYSKNPTVYSTLFSLTEAEAGCTSQPRQFSVQMGERWIHFRQPA